MRSRLARALSGGMGAVLVAGALTGVIAAPAFAAECEWGNPVTPPDVDGDIAADLVVGVPSWQHGTGAVDVRGSASPATVLTAAMLGAGSGQGDGFGSAIAIADLDQDGCADLVIGAPGEGQSAASDGTGDHEGQVHVVFGSRGGIDTGASITLAHNSSDLDRFGSALVLSKRYDGTGFVHDLYVGAPHATVSGQPRAGEVFHYSLSPEPGSRVRATLRGTRSQDSAGVPGAAEAGDRFGSVLASTRSGGVLIGVPDEDIGSAKDAGAAYFLRVDATTGAPVASQSWSQASPSVAGGPEPGDHFGAAIGSRWSRAVIGVPDEDQGARANSGMIQTLRLTTSGAFVPGRGLTQDSPGVLDRLEAGDRFGAAVAVGIALTGYTEATDVAVGAPGEDIGGAANAGAINLVNLKIEDEHNEQGPQPRLLRQGSGLSGSAEAGDKVGSVLGLTLAYSESDTDFQDRLLVGVPDEDLGGDANAGMVNPASTFSTGNQPNLYYGQVLAIPSD